LRLAKTLAANFTSLAQFRLKDEGTLNATETLHAWLSLYDPTDCTEPRLLCEMKWPEPVHTIPISPDGQLVYGAILNPFTGPFFCARFQMIISCFQEWRLVIWKATCR
jgi:hypothetical protein